MIRRAIISLFSVFLFSAITQGQPGFHFSVFHFILYDSGKAVLDTTKFKFYFTDKESNIQYGKFEQPRYYSEDGKLYWNSGMIADGKPAFFVIEKKSDGSKMRILFPRGGEKLDSLQFSPGDYELIYDSNKQLLINGINSDNFSNDSLQKRIVVQSQAVPQTTDSLKTIKKDRCSFFHWRRTISTVITYYPGGQLKSKEKTCTKETLTLALDDGPDRITYYYKKTEYYENRKNKRSEYNRFGNYYPYYMKSIIIVWEDNGKKTKKIQYK